MLGPPTLNNVSKKPTVQTAATLGPCVLRNGHYRDAFSGRGEPLPYGQVYATLSRLARDGKRGE
jgi:hypothetical protein